MVSIRHAKVVANKLLEQSAISLLIVSMEMASFKHVNLEKYFIALWKCVFIRGNA